jgi:hypothetical protein
VVCIQHSGTMQLALAYYTIDLDVI